MVDLSPTAAKPGWEFLGWNTNRDARAAMSPFAVAGNTTLYAIYRRQVAIIFNDYSHSGAYDAYGSFLSHGNSQRLWRYNNEPAAMAAPALHTLNGWTPVGWTASSAPGAAAEYTPGQTISVTETAEFYGLYQRQVSIAFHGTSTSSSLPAVLKFTSRNKTVSYPVITMPAAPPESGGSGSWHGHGTGQAYAPGESAAALDLEYSWY